MANRANDAALSEVRLNLLEFQFFYLPCDEGLAISHRDAQSICRPGNPSVNSRAARIVKCRASTKERPPQSAHYQWFGNRLNFTSCFMPGNWFELEHPAFAIESPAWGTRNVYRSFAGSSQLPGELKWHDLFVLGIKEFKACAPGYCSNEFVVEKLR